VKPRPEWILASGSPRRKALLARLNPDFRVATAEVEEWEPDFADPVEQVAVNALRKGEAAARRYPEAFVIAADTTVALGDRLFAKPRDRAEAVTMLQELSGQSHEVVTGVCLAFGRLRHRFHDTSRVFFRELTTEMIEHYLERVHVYDKAGAYGIQDHGSLIIERYEGSFENIMGLPVHRLVSELLQIDWMRASS
jgi:septum formation protein